MVVVQSHQGQTLHVALAVGNYPVSIEQLTGHRSVIDYGNGVSERVTLSSEQILDRGSGRPPLPWVAQYCFVKI